MIFLYGAGALGREVYEWARMTQPDLRAITFIDDDHAGEALLTRDGPQIVRGPDFLEDQEAHEVIVAIANPRGREQVALMLERCGFRLGGLRCGLADPTAEI